LDGIIALPNEISRCADRAPNATPADAGGRADIITLDGYLALYPGILPYSGGAMAVGLVNQFP